MGMTTKQQTAGISGSETVAISCLLIALVSAQLFLTQAAMTRMVYEELAESVRNPYWASHLTLYDRISSNIGWYGILAFVYSIVGFDVHTAKWIRLAMHAVSLLVLARLFIRWQGALRGSSLLAIVGLSSTWLYCNTYQTSYGIDLQFVPLLLSILVFSRNNKKDWGRSAFRFGILSCFAALCYPTVILYLPLAFLCVLSRLRSTKFEGGWKKLRALFVGFSLGFYLPIGTVCMFLKDPSILLNGIFRGGGAGLSFDFQVIKTGIDRVLRDLFVKPSSYCFDLPHVEFTNWILRTLVFIGLCGAIFHLLSPSDKNMQQGRYKLGLGLSVLCMIWFLIVPSFIPNEPGIRRSTGILVGYYGMVSFLAVALWNKSFSSHGVSIQPFVGWTFVTLHLIGSGLTLYNNLSDYGSIAGRHNEQWLRIEGAPRDSIEYWYQEAKAGKPIECRNFGKECRFAVRFACIRGFQEWNDREEFPVYGIDPRTQEVKTLSLSIWERWEWPH